MITAIGRRIGALACAGVLLGACGTTTGSDVAVVASPSATATSASSRALEVYATVIRQLVTVDHTFGDGPSPFKHVWVVDAPVDGVGAFGARPTKRGTPFDAELRAGLTERLADLKPVDFVSDADEVRQMGRDPEVKDNGVIVTVGPIEEHGKKIHVAHEIWCGGLCAEWFTYVLEKRGDAWVITGDTGPRAIS